MAISIIILFFLLAKMIIYIMKWYLPIVGVFCASCLVALLTVSVYGQMGPDYLDPRYPSPIAWYIRYSCQPAEKLNQVRACQVAKGTFAATVYLLYVTRSLLTWSPDTMSPLELNADSTFQ